MRPGTQDSVPENLAMTPRLFIKQPNSCFTYHTYSRGTSKKSRGNHPPKLAKTTQDRMTGPKRPGTGRQDLKFEDHNWTGLKISKASELVLSRHPEAFKHCCSLDLTHLFTAIPNSQDKYQGPLCYCFPPTITQPIFTLLWLEVQATEQINKTECIYRSSLLSLKSFQQENGAITQKELVFYHFELLFSDTQ